MPRGQDIKPELRFRVRFDQRSRISDPGGDMDGPWVEQFTRWAEIMPVRGREQVIGQKLTQVQTILVRVVYDSDTAKIIADTSYRLVELKDGVPIGFYDITSAEDRERSRDFVTIEAEKNLSQV